MVSIDESYVETGRFIKTRAHDAHLFTEMGGNSISLQLVELDEAGGASSLPVITTRFKVPSHAFQYDRARVPRAGSGPASRIASLIISAVRNPWR